MFLISGESRGSLTWESYRCDLKRPVRPSRNVPERLPSIPADFQDSILDSSRHMNCIRYKMTTRKPPGFHCLHI